MRSTPWPMTSGGSHAIGKVLPFEGDDANHLRIALGDGGHRQADARFVTPRPQAGDEVLLVGDDADGWFVLATTAAPTPALELTDGTRVACASGRDEIAVERADGVELFRYRVADGGRVVLRGEGVDLDAGEGEVVLRGRTVRTESRSLDVQADHTSWRSRRFEGQVDRATLQARRIETTAETIVENARDVFRKVSGLAQLQAERCKTIVSKVFQLRAKRVAQRADVSYKIRSEKIHLG